MKLLIKTSFYFILIFIFSCNEKKTELGLKTGKWRGEITAQNNRIPFNFEVLKNKGTYKINLINGDEVLEIDDINIIGDSLFFNINIFVISIKAIIKNNYL